MKDDNSKFYLKAIVGLALLGVLVFAVTFFVRSKQLDNYVENLSGAVDDTEPEEEFDITALKVGFEGETYTLDEFVLLDEIPVVIDVLIMQSDGTLDNKPAYVSFAVDDTESIQYVDGEYGRLILPMKYNKGVD